MAVFRTEASHGTHEFYRERAVLTKRLILEKGFSAVAIEGDWPDASRVHRYVGGEPGDADAVEALSGFERFPSWMWRNADVLDFVGWLRAHNDRLGERNRKVGFYGLDLYSLHASIAAVLSYLGKVDPAAALRAGRPPLPVFPGRAGEDRRVGPPRGAAFVRD
jgi:erythromycin esterase-like protein